MITKRIYLIFPKGIGANHLAHMLEYDDNVEKTSIRLKNLTINKAMIAEKTLIVYGENVNDIPQELLEDSVFVLHKDCEKPDIDPLYIFEFNVDLFLSGVGFGYTKEYFNDLFGIELQPEALILYENTVH
jgi:hypothetical protein|tara:strand:+ start:63 stop:452 length:390 start_codon:yes stop_codon:yes gene_type:complete